MVKKLKSLYLLAMAVSVITLFVLYKPLNAQQIATQILDDVVIERADYNAVIKVLFKRPFRYISHSPAKTGNSINVRISILEGNLINDEQIIDSESIVIKDGKSTGLTEVIYDNSGRNSKYVILYFNKDVSFEVIQGSDQRNLSFIIYGLE